MYPECENCVPYIYADTIYFERHVSLTLPADP
jgi:hypothetical protein